MTKKIEIPLSKNKLFLGIGGCLLFVILGIWLFNNTEIFNGNSTQTLRNPTVVKSIALAGILFFGAVGIFALKKIFDKKPGLIIDENGITDNSNGGSIGFIKWSDIKEIVTQQVMSSKFLLIHVENPEKYIAKAKNGMKAKLMRANMKMYGTPLSITSNTLKYNFKKLETLLQHEFEIVKNLKPKV